MASILTGGPKILAASATERTGITRAAGSSRNLIATIAASGFTLPDSIRIVLTMRDPARRQARHANGHSERRSADSTVRSSDPSVFTFSQSEATETRFCVREGGLRLPSRNPVRSAGGLSAVQTVRPPRRQPQDEEAEAESQRAMVFQFIDGSTRKYRDRQFFQCHPNGYCPASPEEIACLTCDQIQGPPAVECDVVAPSSRRSRVASIEPLHRVHAGFGRGVSIKVEASPAANTNECESIANGIDGDKAASRGHSVSRSQVAADAP